MRTFLKCLQFVAILYCLIQQISASVNATEALVNANHTTLPKIATTELPTTTSAIKSSTSIKLTTTAIPLATTTPISNSNKTTTLKTLLGTLPSTSVPQSTENQLNNTLEESVTLGTLAMGNNELSITEATKIYVRNFSASYSDAKIHFRWQIDPPNDNIQIIINCSNELLAIVTGTFNTTSSELAIDKNASGTTFECELSSNDASLVIDTSPQSVQVELDTSELLQVESRNSSELYLHWRTPSGSYDNVSVRCDASADANSQRFANSPKLVVVQEYKRLNSTVFNADDLIAGLNYTCLVVTTKTGFTSRTSASKSEVIMPYQIVLKERDVVYTKENNSFSVSFESIPGYFNTISIKMNSTYTNTFTYDDLLGTKSTQIQIKLNEIGSEYYLLKLSVNVAKYSLVTEEEVITPPVGVEDIQIVTQSKESVKILWSNKHDRYFSSFSVKLDGAYVDICRNIKTQSCYVNQLEFNRTHKFEILTSIVSEVNKLNLNATKVKNFTLLPRVVAFTVQKALYNANNPSYGCELSWTIEAADCDNFNELQRFSIEQRPEKANISIWRAISPTNTNCILNTTYISETDMSCTQKDTQLTCRKLLDNLNANTNYTFGIKTSTKFNLFDIIASANGSCKTDVGPPSVSAAFITPNETDITVTSDKISFYLPKISQESGNISLYWVYLFPPNQISDEDFANSSYFESLISKMASCGSLAPTPDCPLVSSDNATRYQANKRVEISREPLKNRAETDYFKYDLNQNTDYNLFIVYSIYLNRSRSARSIASVALDTNIYFRSEIFTARTVKQATPQAKTTSIESWVVAIICISVLLVLFVAVAGALYTIRRRKFLQADKLNAKRILTPEMVLGVELRDVEPSDTHISEIQQMWLLKHANNDLIFEDEYRRLPDYRRTKTAEASRDNPLKNRFGDIVAYDETRVVLENNPYGDYINANFIKGYSHPKKFIATQGPTRETLNDFWHMVWQYRVNAIVMLTNLIEKNNERCTLYWPDEINCASEYGNYEVVMRDSVKTGEYYKRVFDVSLVKPVVVNGPSLSRPKIHVVTQYFYPEWPDKDTPTTDALSILHLINDVNKAHPSYQYPIVVHCSAGVGRTGTYIALDAMFEQLATEAKMNPFKFIKEIREQRQYLVQTSKQYVFIHEALKEYCLYGFTNVEANSLVSHYKYLKEKSLENANKERLLVEFEKLAFANSQRSQTREACSAENRLRNRNLNYVCYDENRVKLSSLNGCSYINATKIAGYESPNEFIITQDPMESTVFDFWKMISEYNCQIIVMLNKSYSLETKSVYFPLDNGETKTVECDDFKFTITHLEFRSLDSAEHSHGSIIRREYDVIQNKHGTINKFKVTQFIFNENWPEDTSPPNRTVFLDLVAMVQKLNNKLGKSSIVVHAFNGGSNCSVFCALCILLDQFKSDQYVDVCRTVKRLKYQRAHMIEKYEQYEFLYQCLVEFVEMFGLYSESFDHYSTTTTPRNMRTLN